MIDSRSSPTEFGKEGQLLRAFARLTPKQHEVLSFVAENRTSKEIAWELGISESAVNQRIESVRARTGAPPRAELARVYRQFQADQDATCNPILDKNLQLPDEAEHGDQSYRDDRIDAFELSDATLAEPFPVHVREPWLDGQFERVVPEVLDGKNAGLSRTAAIVAISGGLLVVAMLGLSFVQALNSLL